MRMALTGILLSINSLTNDQGGHPKTASRYSVTFYFYFLTHFYFMCIIVLPECLSVRVLDPLKLGLQAIVSFHVDARD